MAALGCRFFQHFVAVVGVNNVLAAMIVDVGIALFLAFAAVGVVAVDVAFVDDVVFAFAVEVAIVVAVAIAFAAAVAVDIDAAVVAIVVAMVVAIAVAIAVAESVQVVAAD